MFIAQRKKKGKIEQVNFDPLRPALGFALCLKRCYFRRQTNQSENWWTSPNAEEKLKTMRSY
jgi:hypothetical protein